MNKAVSIFILSIFELIAATAWGAPEKAGEPQSGPVFKVMDMIFLYDEDWVLAHLNAITDPRADSDIAKQAKVLSIDVAWYLICLGEYSTGNSEVETAIHKAMDYAGESTVPYWVCFPEQHEKILAYYSAANTVTGSAFFFGFRDKRLVQQIARDAMRKIETRGSYVFKPYPGTHWATP